MPPVKMRGTQKPRNAARTILRLLSYMGKFRALWPVVFVCVVVSAFSEVAGAYLLKPAINDYIIPLVGKKGADMAGLLRIVSVMAGIYVCGALCSFLSARILLKISTGTLLAVRRDLFCRLQELPVRFHDSRTHGETMSLFTNDTDTLRDMFSQTVPQLFTALFQVSGIFVMMLVLSVPLAVLVVATVAVIMLVVSRIGKRSAAAFRSQQANIAKVNGFIEELVEGQKVVTVFGREKKSCEQFAGLNDMLCESGTSANTYASILGPLMNNMSHAQYALCAIAGAFLVILGRMDIGTVASFLQSLRNFSRPLSQMSQQFNSILNALAGAERIFAVIDEKAEVDDGDVSLVNASEFMDSFGWTHVSESFARTGEWAWKDSGTGQLKRLRGDVSIGNVDFSYVEGTPVLRNVSIKAAAGQRIALVGSTGSGKTTVANLIARFYDVGDGHGEILFDGIPVKDIRKGSLRRALGMVLQDTHLFTASVRDNIRYGNLDASDAQVEAAAKLANADSFIRKLSDGYDTVLTGGGSEISQGQRQLLSIARAAVADPPVLILDEATSSIDTRTERLIQQGMDRLMKGRTVFVIAHRLSTVRNADVIVVFERGAVIESGTHEELLARRGRYWQLYTGAFVLS